MDLPPLTIRGEDGGRERQHDDPEEVELGLCPDAHAAGVGILPVEERSREEGGDEVARQEEQRHERQRLHHGRVLCARLRRLLGSEAVFPGYHIEELCTYMIQPMSVRDIPSSQLYH